MRDAMAWMRELPGSEASAADADVRRLLHVFGRRHESLVEHVVELEKRLEALEDEMRTLRGGSLGGSVSGEAGEGEGLGLPVPPPPKLKPWEVEGIKRGTWYWRKREARLKAARLAEADEREAANERAAEGDRGDAADRDDAGSPGPRQ